MVAQRGVWRDAASGTARGETDVATRFGVVGRHVAEIERYDDPEAALRDAGVVPADA